MPAVTIIPETPSARGLARVGGWTFWTHDAGDRYILEPAHGLPVTVWASGPKVACNVCRRGGCVHERVAAELRKRW